MDAFTLYDLNEFVRRAVSLNFPKAVWLYGETSQVNISGGHYFIEFVQRDEESDKILAQSSAILWADTARKLKRKMGRKMNLALKEGQEILVKVYVEFHERYGLKLNIIDIDQTFVEGQLAIFRQEQLAQLKKEKLLGKNSQLPLLPAIQKIAVIASKKSAGYQDFDKQLHKNPFGYQFKCRHFQAFVQGEYAVETISEAMDKIAWQENMFDAVVMIRGGGAKTDLMAFDSLELSRKIANFPLPFFTGIGHDIDESLVDLVAWKALKTPTAAADYIVNHNMVFESSLNEISFLLEREVRQLTTVQLQSLETFSKVAFFQSKQIVEKAQDATKFLEEKLNLATHTKLDSAQQQIEQFEQICKLSDPKRLLKKGYAIVRKNGKLQTQTKGLKKGDVLEIEFQNGKLDTTVD